MLSTATRLKKQKKHSQCKIASMKSRVVDFLSFTRSGDHSFDEGEWEDFRSEFENMLEIDYEGM